MKAILEFNLPEETEAHECALNGGKYKDCLMEMMEYLIDYEERDIQVHERDAARHIQKQLLKIINSRGVELYK